VKRGSGAAHKRGGWWWWWLGPSASAYRPELDTHNDPLPPHSSFLLFHLLFAASPPPPSTASPPHPKAVMHGPHSRLLLLTIALLLEETLRILLPCTQDGSRSDLRPGSCAPNDVERRKRSLWLSGALASPILEARNQSGSSQSIQGSTLEDVLQDYAPVMSAESTSRQTRLQRVGSPTNGQDDMDEQHLLPPSTMYAPMGWADPRLRGGQMLDVSLKSYPILLLSHLTEC
jgi:hypothetical protein